MHCDGTPHDGAPNRDGVVLEAARTRKERRYPELVGPLSRAHLAVEVGGRWSAETSSFLSQLAKAKARQETPLLQKRAEQAWRLRWAGILCSAAKAVASSLQAEGAHAAGQPTMRWVGALILVFSPQT